MPNEENKEVKVGNKDYTLKEALHGNILTVEALINVLAAKGVLTRAEVHREIKKIQAEIGKQKN
jgi:hypothetical protein